MNRKLKELRKIEREFKRKIPERVRIDKMGKMFGGIVSVLARNLIKDVGYSVATKIIKREFRSLGRNDAKYFIELFKLKRGSIKDASKALKIAALFLGLKLDVVGNETIVKDCPLGNEAIKFDEPILCNACLEYNNGILEEMLGEGKKLKRTKWIFEGDGYCMFTKK